MESPWWPDVEPVNLALSAALRVETSVLRLVAATGTAPRDGEVSYHVEVAAEPSGPQPWLPIDEDEGAALLAPHPRRRAWAVPGGPAAEVAWADDILAANGTPRNGLAVQVKTWNLSSVHRLPTATGHTWLKATGPEQTREELPMAAVARHDASLVAHVVAADSRARRLLCADLPGMDLADAPLGLVLPTIERWVAAQAAIAAAGAAHLVDTGVPAEPLDALAPGLELLLDSAKTARLTQRERSDLTMIIRDLPGRIDRLAATGLPNTLQHGDFTPVNWHGGESGVALMDWADAYVGHPAHDLGSLLGRLPAAWHPAATDVWCRSWARFGPPSDPAGAAELAKALVPLRSALLYARFLDAIEPSEWCYHEDDPVFQLRLALRRWDDG